MARSRAVVSRAVRVRVEVQRKHTRVTSAHTQDDLTNVDTGDSAVGLAPGTTHTGLQSIGTGARQHLVDTDDVVRVGADTHVESLLSGVLDEVLVGANTGGLEGLGAQLLILVGDEVDAEREVVNVGLLAAKIENSDLGVGNTTVEPRLGIRLKFTMSAFLHFVIHFPPPEKERFAILARPRAQTVIGNSGMTSSLRAAACPASETTRCHHFRPSQPGHRMQRSQQPDRFWSLFVEVQKCVLTLFLQYR